MALAALAAENRAPMALAAENRAPVALRAWGPGASGTGTGCGGLSAVRASIGAGR